MHAKLSVAELENELSELRKYLPKQGSLENFVHLNTLRDFEDLNFHDALAKVAHLRQSKSYLDLESYAQKINEGRIEDDQIQRYLTPEVLGITEVARLLNIDDLTLFKKIVFLPTYQQNATTIAWALRQDSSLGCERRAIWQTITNLTAHLAIKRQTLCYLQLDSKKLRLANDVTIDFLSAYFDKGVSSWHLEHNPNGLLATFIDAYFTPDQRLPKWLRRFQGEIAITADDSFSMIQSMLSEYAFAGLSLREFLYEIMRDVEGWAGLLCFYETSNENIRLLDFLALRLFIFKSMEVDKSAKIVTKLSGQHLDTIRFDCLLLLRDLGYKTTSQIPIPAIMPLASLLLSLTASTKQRILHQAYESTYYAQIANSIAMKARKKRIKTNKKPSFSAIFCIDDREESFRRHLEELDDLCQTYGYAGFFNMLIGFKEHSSSGHQNLCPLNIEPQFFVIEHIISQTFFASRLPSLLHRMRKIVLGKASVIGLNSLLFLAIIFGDLIRFLSPNRGAIWFKSISRFIKKNQKTAVNIDDTLSFSSEDHFLDEIAAKIASMLKTIGIAEKISDLIFVIGHGSTSLNNPHQTAYACGACGGKAGGPNARVFAALANSLKVRQKIKILGINLPETTWFIGAYHDTCLDSIECYDTTLIPAYLRTKYAECAAKLESACHLNSQERARRFENVPFMRPKRSAEVLKTRAFMHAQPRAEIGHASNAIAVIGRRDLSKGIFLDRRAFLCSYDSDLDSDSSILANLLAAVVPVCMSINLDYYFSYLDNEKFGSGTKLPHNITSFLGVINGTSGDLRTGLPWQAVELHEPLRLLIIIEAPLTKVLDLRIKLPQIFSLVQKEWLFLAVCENGQITYLNREPLNTFMKPPKVVKRSVDSYWGKRHHLEPVFIGEP